MAAGTPEDPIIKIVYKKRKNKGHAHHGGAWKVAFADFMTAMMALFLVLWIMAQSQEVKQAVASYFRHPTDYEGKADAILRGNMGLMNHKSGRLDTTPNVLDSPGSGTNNERRDQDAANAETVAGAAASISAEQGLRPALVERLAEQEVDDVRTFIDIADNLWQNLGMDPSFMRVKEQLQIETHEDGLVVQIIERPDYPLFEPHTNQFRAEIVRTFEILAKGLKGLPNKLEIDGHGPGLAKDQRSIWLGSAHLADLARAELEKAGIGPYQISKIAGCADRRPLSTQNPLEGVNRRISILVRPRQWQPERY